MTAIAPSVQGALHGRRILVVEDEYMIAMEIAEALHDAGAEALGPVRDVAGALALLAVETRTDAAVLDVNLQGEAVWPLADALLMRGVPLMLATGYDACAIPSAYAQLPRHEKPAAGRDLIRALASMLTSAARM